MKPEKIETVVIGAGQAGLAASHHLERLGCEHVVLERARIAERWRTQRWDSLMFQFPNWSIELPGLRFEAADPEAFSHKDTIVAFLERYRALLGAPVREGVNVRHLGLAPQAGRYRLVTEAGEIEAANVVIATGPYQRPRIPGIAARFPGAVAQVHAGDYRNPDSLPRGAVLVIGTGASGCQIAEELLAAGRRVYLAVGRHRRVPRRYRGRDVFWWRREMGWLDVTADATPPEKRGHPPLVTGVNGGHDVDLRAYAANGMTLLGHVRDVSGTRLALECDLEASLREGDDHYAAFKQAADEHIAATGIDAAREESCATSFPAQDSPAEIDLAAASIGTVLWATGYGIEFDWVDLPVFDARGAPVHRRGVTRERGIYFLGLPWLYKITSTFLAGIGEDAQFVAERIASEAKR